MIGCQHGAINCYVTYMFEYEKGGACSQCGSSGSTTMGLSHRSIVDLTRLADMKNMRLVLTVLASGPATPDQPLWIAPRIVRTINEQGPTPTPVTPTSTGPTNTPVPTAGAACDRAQFISDVTVPDGTSFAPNAAFSKTWRVKNVGTCTWTTAYSVVFASGDRMAGADTLIPQTVVPGQTVDIGVNFTAPNPAGSYRGYWQLKSASGALFGIGSTYDKPFWVDIVVSGSGSGETTAFDFVNSLCTATWSSGSGVLPCPGTDGDARGFVLEPDEPADRERRDRNSGRIADIPTEYLLRLHPGGVSRFHGSDRRSLQVNTELRVRRLGLLRDLSVGLQDRQRPHSNAWNLRRAL